MKTTNPKWEEIILVAPRSKVFENESLAFQGIETNTDKYMKIVGNLGDNLMAIRRGGTNDPTDKWNNAEINEELKQPIPYVLIKRKDEILSYQRLSGGGESRLHDKLSIGFGGHMNPEEGSFSQQLLINLERELTEELNIKSSEKDLTFIGLINDDENEVGRVHLGILAVLTLSDDAEVSVRETDQIVAFWNSLEGLRTLENYNRLEAWSQIAVDIL